MILEKKILWLRDEGLQYLKDKKLIIVYNAVGFTQKIDSSQEDSDFFSNQEIGELFDSLIKMGVKVVPYNNELTFIQDFFEDVIDKSNSIVWNLSRQGSTNNQKSLITSFCDFLKIPYIGSSVYSMNLSRHKYHIQKVLEASNLKTLSTYKLDEFQNVLNTSDKTFLLKKIQGSASRGMSEDTSNLSYSEMVRCIEKIEHQFKQDYIVQEFISGYEIEVPLFQIKGEFQTYGIAGIQIDNEKYLSGKIMQEEMYNSKYTFFDFEEFSNVNLRYSNCNHIYETAVQIANVMELKDYCRIDFRVDHFNQIYCFDISTTPYVTKHSSPNFLFEKHGFEHSDLLLALVGSFSSNIDNH